MEGCAFMTDELKDIIYADLFRYTGNARRYKNIYACYLEERRSSPEFSVILKREGHPLSSAISAS